MADLIFDRLGGKPAPANHRADVLAVAIAADGRVNLLRAALGLDFTQLLRCLRGTGEREAGSEKSDPLH
jgi:hypothetical protein